MQKILMNRKPVNGPWGGGAHFFKAMCQYASDFGYEIVHSFSDNIHGILMVDPRYDELGISVNEILKYKSERPDTIVAHRVNECDARKGLPSMGEMDSLLLQCSKYVDVTIFVSEWMKKYHENNGWMCNQKEVIINGVDTDIYKKYSSDKNNKIKIVVHHWADHPSKNIFTKNIDEFVGKNKEHYSFTFIGRVTCLDLPNTNILPPMYGQALAKELSKHDVYISSSIKDPGPNHILESMACGLPTYAYSESGGGVEFVGQDNVYSNWDELEGILRNKNFIKNITKISNWKNCAEKVFGIFGRK